MAMYWKLKLAYNYKACVALWLLWHWHNDRHCVFTSFCDDDNIVVKLVRLLFCVYRAYMAWHKLFKFFFQANIFIKLTLVLMVIPLSLISFFTCLFQALCLLPLKKEKMKKNEDMNINVVTITHITEQRMMSSQV